MELSLDQSHQDKGEVEKGMLSAATYRRLYLFCLIGTFADGVYGAKRLHKVAYFIDREMNLKPFEFKHYDLGQYSEMLEDIKEQLISMGYIFTVPLESGKGNKYVIIDKGLVDRYFAILARINPKLADKIRETVSGPGYLREDELIKMAYAMPEFIKSRYNETLFHTNLPDFLEVEGLSSDECDELELSLNPSFISAAGRILEGLDYASIDWDKVEKVGL